jgi:hypothetical protein
MIRTYNISHYASEQIYQLQHLPINFSYILQPQSTKMWLIAAASKEDSLLLLPKATQLKPQFHCTRAVTFWFGEGELAGPILRRTARHSLQMRGARRALAAPSHGGSSPRHPKEGARVAIPWRELAAPSHEGTSPRPPMRRGLRASLCHPTEGAHRAPSESAGSAADEKVERWNGERLGIDSVGFFLRKKSQRVSWDIAELIHSAFHVFTLSARKSARRRF